MNAARCQFFGLRPVADTTVVDVTIEEDEIDGGRCELHIDLKRRAGMSFVTMDWGDGTVEAVGGFSPAHSYTRPGVFTLSSSTTHSARCLGKLRSRKGPLPRR